MIAIVFAGVLAAFLIIGLASARRSTGDRQDYYVASQSVSPWMAGLSAVATNNSGYMFIGVIGYTYTTGLAAIWLMVGWILGDFLGSTFIHRRLRHATATTGKASFASVVAGWGGGEWPVWRRIAAILMIVFLAAYAAAQISAGSKALDGVLGVDPRLGAVSVAVIILAYSIAGGIRASIWTDAAQSIVMIVAMTLLFVVALNGVGGLSGAIAKWETIPGFLNLSPPDLRVAGMAGLSLFVIGWLFAGFSVVGQPHVMIRFMALDQESHMTSARAWYYAYFTAFYLLATGVGMLSRLYLPDMASMDPELALPRMAVELLPAALVGVILAGVFAATMSTADSLVLACSSAMTHDLPDTPVERPWILKAATAVSTLGALALALSGNQSVFDLVILAWSTLAVAFAPLLALLALGRRVNEWTAIGLMALGVGVALWWRFGLHLQDDIYEGFPGIVIPFVVGWFASRKVGVEAIRSEAPAEAD
ncbi:MAG: sodium/proline symporter [Hyphomonadaceae bacterium]